MDSLFGALQAFLPPHLHRLDQSSNLFELIPAVFLASPTICYLNLFSHLLGPLPAACRSQSLTYLRLSAANVVTVRNLQGSCNAAPSASSTYPTTSMRGPSLAPSLYSPPSVSSTSLATASPTGSPHTSSPIKTSSCSCSRTSSPNHRGNNQSSTPLPLPSLALSFLSTRTQCRQAQAQYTCGHRRRVVTSIHRWPQLTSYPLLSGIL
ncbi:Os05g0512932 [Oryza sativa Japonica Group]|uniref:Os05g0512932 protein n=1 Tax=Oryza sativa subsp. japonica TaxID=39947 RepID=A0A0P0WPF5_ORYSJ|nr:Os05g0512932 [Oryza sativa Japonica Group]